VISESCARTVFAGEEPIGKGIQLGEWSPARPWATVVGIVGDVRQYGLDRPSGGEVYVSQEQDLVIDYYRLVARTTGDPHLMESTVRSAFMTVDSTLPVYHVKSLEDYLAGTLASRRVALMLLSLFGTLALVLGALGVYGTISYGVALRTRELGVRIAVGAQRRDVLLSVLNQGFALAGGGLTVGFVFSSALNRYLSSLLFEVGPMDVATSAVVGVVLMVVVLLASCIPARRAASIDPIMVLRDE
jgi:putative ABC transport system permease protein